MEVADDAIIGREGEAHTLPVKLKRFQLGFTNRKPCMPVFMLISLAQHASIVKEFIIFQVLQPFFWVGWIRQRFKGRNRDVSTCHSSMRMWLTLFFPQDMAAQLHNLPIKLGVNQALTATTSRSLNEITMLNRQMQSVQLKYCQLLLQ